MPRFDPHKPHSEVHGIVGVRFVQGGHAFNSSGAHVADPEAGTPDLDPGKTVTETFIPRAEVPSPILGPDGLPAQREEVIGPGPLPESVESFLAENPPGPGPKDDMRLKENKMVKLQWEQYHEGEVFPGVAEAKRQLGIA